MRIVFMGTPEFAIPSLDILLKNNLSVPCVVTVPDKPVGRGQQMAGSPVRCFAEDHDIEILQPGDLRDQSFISKLRSYRADAFVVVAFRILPPEVFTIPPKGTINLHASLLPKYRGAAPINWAIINGERETGVTTFFIEENVDTGKIILQARLNIGEDETAGELHGRMAELGAEIVLLSLRLIQDEKAIGHPQDSRLASAAPKIFRNDCRIDWTKNAQQIHNFIRGLSPRPCAFTFDGKTQLKIFRSRLVPGPFKGTAGQVVEADSRFLIQCGDGLLEILEIQQEGKKKMRWDEFLRGYKIEPGQLFH